MSTIGGIADAFIEQGLLFEYTLLEQPLVLSFEFNPSSISRSRSVTVKTGGAPGTRGGYDFQTPLETPRASQGVTVNNESFTIKVLLDATDRMNDGDPIASQYGVQPELDTIRSMLEPKIQGPAGAQLLSSLGFGSAKAFASDQYASVLLFKWGVQVLPVFMTQAQIEVKEYLPTLVPYRAETTMTLQIIESNNLFYNLELKRQMTSAQLFQGAIKNAIDVAESF